MYYYCTFHYYPSEINKCFSEQRTTTWVIQREVTQENPRPPSILMKIDKPIVPHDRNMYVQF